LPTITCPADAIQTADAGVCEALVSIDAPVVADNCTVAGVINDYNGTDNATDVYPVGTTIVTWTVTDIYGNESQCAMEIIVTDDELPTITCPADLTQTADAGVCEALVNVNAPAVNDNCSVANFTNDYNGTSDATDVYPVGTTTITWTVFDLAGNSITCEMTITVTDDEAPAITCPENIVQGTDDGLCEAIVSVDAPVISDNCSVATVTNDYNGTTDASDVYLIGVTTVTWTLVDIHGNVSECSMTVEILDDENPAIACPENMVELVGNACEFVIPDYTGLALATDNCTALPALTQSPAIGTTINGTGAVQEITITATDDSGNATSCTFEITLDDTIAPSIECVENQTVYVDDNCLFMLPDYTTSSIVDDNCGVMNVEQSMVAGTEITLGSYDITVTATDADGNATSCTFTVEVLDNTAPVIACPEDQVEEFDTDCAFALIDYTGLLSANDNCSDVTITQVPPVGTLVTENTTVNLFADDADGNGSFCSFTVILEDTIDPEIMCSENIEVFNDTAVCGAMVIYDAPVATDNCTVASVVITEGLASGETFPVGVTTVTYEVTDGFGNSSSCSFEVTVIDNEAPSIVCPENILVNNDLGVCAAGVIYDLPTTDDNCEVDTLVMTEGLASGEQFPVGETVVTFEVTDIYGNNTTCSFSVTVVDNEVPIVLTCTENITAENDLGLCGATVEFNDPEVTDNCGDVTIVVVSGGLDDNFFEVGTTEVLFQITDAAGNTSFCSFNVTVLDTEAPVVTCPEDIEVENATGICGAFVNFNSPVFEDNCSASQFELTEGIQSGELFPVGVTTQTFLITDDAGNTMECSFTVTVLDAENPIIECPEDMVQIDPLVIYDEPFYADNCNAELMMIEGFESGTEFPHGYTTVTFVAYDLAGNADTCSFEVLINTPPIGEDDVADFLEEDDEIEIDPLDNDWDPDGDDIHLGDAWADNGEVEILDDMIIYTAPEDWCGTDTVTYVVCDIYNACDTAQIVIQVECFIDLIIPQGFSPNGDGVNDAFEILGLEDYPDNKLSIFNRWGHQVFEAENYQNDWNGTAQEKMKLGRGYLPKGTYFFVLDLGVNQMKVVKGYIYLNY
jgi:gliding motility-associated-like protein